MIQEKNNLIHTPMNFTQNKIQLAQRILSTEDKNVVKAINLIFTQEDDHYEITDDQKPELDRRLKDIESGNAKFYTWEQAKKIIRKKAKK